MKASRTTSTNTATARPTQQGRRISAIIAQIGSFLTTLSFTYAISFPLEYTPRTIEHILVWIIASGLEYVLFWSKGELLLEQRWSTKSIIAIATDTILNSGGLWLFVLRINQTQQYQMLSAGLQLNDEIRLLPAMIIALILGFGLSIAPHKLWKD